MGIYAIGDIHGHIDLLLAVHELIAKDMQAHGHGQVVHVGDLVDRGPDSKAVVEYLRQGVEQGKDWVVLKGNHDRMFLRFLKDPYEPEPGLRSELAWLHPRLGGGATLQSYGVLSAADRPIDPVHADALKLVPENHQAFLATRPVMHRVDDVVFVHAGINPAVALDEQVETDLLWIRAPFLEYQQSFGPLIVHGHTAIDRPTHYGNRVNIDSSAAYGGPVSAIVIDAGQVFHLTNDGRQILQPT